MASPMSWEEARDRLKKLREEQSRNSREVVELWSFLSHFTDKLGNEVWLVYEQVCMAAIDCGEVELAQRNISILNAQFPNSIRVKNLEGLLFEAKKCYDDAEDKYRSILDEQPTNALAEKRLVVIFKAQNKIKEAISELNKYLEKHMADVDSWLELCDLYMSQMDYAHAAFCMEELLLANPHNHLFHQRYAEIKYTQGGTGNLEEARSYFAQAVKLNPNSVRALYGLFLSASNLASRQKEKEQKNIKYAAWAAEQISQQYANKLGSATVQDNPAQLKAIGGMFDKLSLTSS